MNPWPGNLEVVQARFPETARRIERVRPAAGIPVWSEGDAGILAQRWLSGLSLRPGALIALAGFGDGSHVSSLLKTLPAHSMVFVAEADPSELRGVLERVDVTAVLRDERIMLGVGEPDEAMLSLVRGEHAVAMTDIVPVVFAPGFNRAPEYFARFFTEFARFVDFRRKLEGTRMADAPMWQVNTFANLPVLADAPDLMALRDVFRGRSAVLVSAGPSLDESLEFLHEAARTSVIIAVNSSYRAVRNAGVVPHLVLAADPREFTARGFANLPVDRTWLVTTPIVHPDVPRMFGGRVFIWSGGNELFTEIRRRCGLEPGSRIVEQGTVSACAVDLAIIMGCERLCLVGQDLAIRPDGRSHTLDSFYSDSGINHADTSACRRLPGNTQPEVLVEDKLYVYLKTFEQLVAQRPQLRFRNTSRLGARIAGIPYATFSDALAWLGKKPLGDVQAAFAKRCIRERPFAMRLPDVVAALASTHGYTHSALSLALKCAARCEAIPESFASEGSPDDPRVTAAMEAARELDAHLQSAPAEYAILESGRTRLELFRAQELGKRIGGAADLWRAIVLAGERAWAIAEGAWFLLNQLDRFARETAPGEPSAKTS